MTINQKYEKFPIPRIPGTGTSNSGVMIHALQGTLALIKPDAFQRRIEIEEIILKEGITTL